MHFGNEKVGKKMVSIIILPLFYMVYTYIATKLFCLREETQQGQEDVILQSSFSYCCILR